jgi:hypothetical protein
VAFTEVYVDPSIAADSGTGTIGDPYGDLEYAIEQTTFDTVNGTRVNVKAGTAEVLAADLTTAMADVVTTVAWAPSSNVPFILQGYTAVAGDGGVAEIDCGSNQCFSSTTDDGVWTKDLRIHGTNANPIIRLDDYIIIEGCHVSNYGTGEAITFGNYGRIVGNYIDEADGTHAISCGTVAEITHNYVAPASGTPSNALITMSGGDCSYNVVIMPGATNNGIRALNTAHINNNSIYSTGAGVGNGIHYATSTGFFFCSNNLVEGFSGAGGIGIRTNQTSATNHLRGNAVYNCTTAYEAGGVYGLDEDNETLTASPFNDAANGDFSPVSVGNVIEGALPAEIGGGLV